MRQRWYRSTDGARHWEPIAINPRSPLAALPLKPGEVYDDGQGHLYRYEILNNQEQ